MNDLTLVILAAGMGSRFGGLKQVEPIGPNGEFIIDYSIYDAIKAGFTKVVFIIKEENYDLFRETVGNRVSKHIPVEYCFQDINNVPEGVVVPSERVKPWGTAHAILCCKDVVKENFERANIYINNIKNVKVLPYIYNMEELINISDLLVCRSGAMTITEISIVGKPAIFIPLPSMSANRQEDNALVLKKIGAAKIILNNAVNGNKLSEEIDDIIYDKLELEEMGKIANSIAPSNVEEKIYEEIKKLIKE